jgi:DNA-binding CsgD family transcriptional regulator
MTRRTVGVTSDRAAQEPARAVGRAAPTEAGEVVDSPAMWDAHVARCLDGLSAPARRLVEVGAVFGSSFTIADAADVLGQPVGSLMAAVEEAVDTGALVLTPVALEFRHDGIRRVAYDAVPLALVTALHRQIGELLLPRREWAAAADHLMRGVMAGDSAAAAGLERVARQVRTSSPEWASELALRALALTDASDVDRFARAATVVENMVTAGRLEEADFLARRTLASHGVPPPAAARLRLALTKLLLFAGRPRTAVDEIRSLQSETLVPGSLRAPAELFLLWAMLALDDWPGAAGQVEAILSGGRGRDEVLPSALAALGVITWRDGIVADGLALTRAAVLRSDREPGATGDPFARACLARMLTALGDLDEATHAIESAQASISATGETLWSAAPAIAAAGVDLAAGRVDAASASAHAAIDLATELGTSCFLPPARMVLAEVALMGGDLSEAAAHLECGDSDVAWPPWTANSRRLAEARLAEAEGGPQLVLERYANVFDDVAVDARLVLDDPRAAAWLVRTALAGDEPDRAEWVVARAEHLAVVNAAFPAVVAASLHARGLADSDPCVVQEAADLHRHVGARAAAWEDAGVLRLGSGDRSAGRDLLERAVAAYQQCGAERDAARVRSRLRAIGVRWRHGRRADRPVSGWGSLTDTERAVAALVAEGLTNAEVAERMYLSRHTVDFNLRQIFRKLGIRSRVALTRLYLERQRGADATDHASL